jgi:hypothetical protein
MSSSSNVTLDAQELDTVARVGTAFRRTGDQDRDLAGQPLLAEPAPMESVTP